MYIEQILDQLVVANREQTKLIRDLKQRIEILESFKGFKLFPHRSEEFYTIEEISMKIRKSQKTVHNYCRDYPKIKRKRVGRENLVCWIDFEKAFEKGRTTPFDSSVFKKKDLQ